MQKKKKKKKRKKKSPRESIVLVHKVNTVISYQKK